MNLESTVETPASTCKYLLGVTKGRTPEMKNPQLTVPSNISITDTNKQTNKQTKKWSHPDLGARN